MTFSGVGVDQTNSQLDFGGGDPDCNLDLGSWITICIQDFLQDSLFTITIPTDSQE